MPNRVDIAAFQKVMIVYNRNSGKQLFASMLARVNEVKKRLKQVIDPKSLEIVEIKSFEPVSYTHLNRYLNILTSVKY